jgi:hypothetical protein
MPMRIVVASETYQNYENDAVINQLTDFSIRREEFGGGESESVDIDRSTEMHRYSLPWRNLENNTLSSLH